MPPMNINVIDHRNFGRRPLVGTYVLKSLENFRCNSAGTARSLGVEGLWWCFISVEAGESVKRG